MQITTWSCGSSAQSALIVATPSQPGGMRMSTKATWKGSCAARARAAARTPSWPWYADSTSKEMQAFIRSRRDIHEEPGKELKDFEEYAHLYQLAWSDGANRWLLSCVPSAMIFDDHDIRDDWNASLDWKRKMDATNWWHERIVAGLSSYWVYQHLGNLSPRERAEDAMW